MFNKILNNVVRFFKMSILVLWVVVSVVSKAVVSFIILPMVIVENFVLVYILRLKPLFSSKLLWFIYFIDLHSNNVKLRLLRWNNMSMHDSSMRCLSNMSVSYDQMSKLRMKW